MKKKRPPQIDTFYDRSYWLAHLEDHHLRWIEALEAIDARDDYEPWLALLATVVPPVVAPHIRDLFTRKRLTNRVKGAQPTPTYDRTQMEQRLELAAIEVRNWIRQNKGMTVKKAIDDVAPEYHCDPSTLASYMSGKYGSTRRMKKRRAAPIKSLSGR